MVTSIPTRERENKVKKVSNGRSCKIGRARRRKEGGRTVGDVNLRVSRSDGSELPELLKILDGELVAEKVEHNVLESATVFRRNQERKREEKESNVRERDDRQPSELAFFDEKR